MDSAERKYWHRVEHLHGTKWDWENENLKRIGAANRFMDIEEANYLWEVCGVLLLPSPFKFQLIDVARAPRLEFWCFEDMADDVQYRRFRKSVGQIAKYFNVTIHLKAETVGGKLWVTEDPVKWCPVAGESEEIPGLKIVIYDPRFAREEAARG